MEEEAATEALVERLFGACIGALDLLHVYVGDRLGLYGVLAANGPLTSSELAGRAGIHERYAGSGWSTRLSPASSRSTTVPVPVRAVSPFHQGTVRCWWPTRACRF